MKSGPRRIYRCIHYCAKISSYSGFCDCLSDSLLRDRTVLRINNHSLRKRLLQERNLDLKKCINLCRSSDRSCLLPKIKFQIVCEASINIITRCNTRKSHVTPSNKTLKMWNGTEIKPLGTTRLKVTNPKTGK